MKKIVGRALIISFVIAVFGTVGRMEFSDQQADAARTFEIRNRVTFPSNRPPTLKQLCFSPGSYLQHCEAQLH